MLLQITVYESLVYSARLRFNRDVEQEIVYAFVQEVRPCNPPAHRWTSNPFLFASAHAHFPTALETALESIVELSSPRAVEDIMYSAA